MIFYTKQDKFYCGIDLHAKKCTSASSIKQAKSGCTGTSRRNGGYSLLLSSRSRMIS